MQYGVHTVRSMCGHKCHFHSLQVALLVRRYVQVSARFKRMQDAGGQASKQATKQAGWADATSGRSSYTPLSKIIDMDSRVVSRLTLGESFHMSGPEAGLLVKHRGRCCFVGFKVGWAVDTGVHCMSDQTAG